MTAKTLIIGDATLPQDLSGRKPFEIRADKYFKDLLAEFDLD